MSDDALRVLKATLHARRLEIHQLMIESPSLLGMSRDDTAREMQRRRWLDGRLSALNDTLMWLAGGQAALELDSEERYRQAHTIPWNTGGTDEHNSPA